MIKFTFDQDSEIHRIYNLYAKMFDLRVSQVYRKVTADAVKTLQKEIDERTKNGK